MLKKYFHTITLFTVMAFLSVTAFIIVAISRQPEGVKSLVLFRLAIAALLFFATDILLKQILKLKPIPLWLTQILLLLLAVYIWIIS